MPRTQTPADLGIEEAVDPARLAGALPAYRLGPELARGGFGQVVLAHHAGLDRDVAIKVLAAAGERAHATFRSEARVLALLDHPHIVSVYDYVESDGLCLIIMELLRGGPLSKWSGPLAAEAICAIGVAVADALACAHSHGLLHRDIKPENILFTANGVPKVADFGIAKILEQAIGSPASRVIGTPRYMAPEQFLRAFLTFATDVYGLGRVMYEQFCGHLPYDAKLPLRLLLQPPPMASTCIPPIIGDVLQKALMPDPADRFATARDFALALANASFRTFGPKWTSRSSIILRLDEELREATETGGTVAGITDV